MIGRAVFGRIAIVLCLLMEGPAAVAQQPAEAAAQEPTAADVVAHPLEPLDTSSPRSTLLGFLANGDAVGRFYRDVYRTEPTIANLRTLLLSRLRASRRVMDLSDTPPAIRDRFAIDASAHLYEVLSRIELPPASAIPGPDAVAGNSAPGRWTVPDTDITLVRVTDGPRQGDYLFSAETVDRAADLYGLARSLPYRRAVPTGDVVELRRVSGGFLIPPQTIEALPGWARASVLGLVLWKWIALGLFGFLLAGLLTVVRAAAAHGRRRFRDRPVATSLLRLLVPVTILVMAPLATVVANGVINVTESLGSAIRIVSEGTAHVVGAWIAWVVSVTIAESVIASPRVAEGTLDAQVLRLCSRIVGMVLAVTLILVGGEQVGLPLIGLLAGVGIGGLAIALAAQDTLRNILGSLMIFFDKPYRAGHRIVVLGHDGEVEQIGLRSTRIRLLNGNLTTIPNEKMASTDIENVSQRRYIRRDIRLGLTYDTSPEKLDRAIALVREVLSGHSAHWGNMPPRVYFEDFAADHLTLVAYTWYHPADYWDFAAAHDRINLQILRRFAEEGIAFAFPTTTMVLEPGSAPVTVNLTGAPPGPGHTA